MLLPFTVQHIRSAIIASFTAVRAIPKSLLGQSDEECLLFVAIWNSVYLADRLVVAAEDWRFEVTAKYL